MEGVAWGAAAGLAFGLFQATNRRANRGVDPFFATFTVILTSLLVLAGFAVVVEDPSRLIDAEPSALLAFAAAGMCNFFLGWTFLALAQQRVGASRTSVIAGTAPLFGTAIAFLFIGESVHPLGLFGVVLVVGGVALLAGSRRPAADARVPGGRIGLLFAGLTALSWGVSAVLARFALDQVPSPLSGLTVGMAASAIAYGVVLAIRGVRQDGRGAARLSLPAIGGLMVAGLFVATGIGTQWIALGLAPVAIVLALNQLSVPVVLLVAPFIVGTSAERLTRKSVIGAAITVVGTVIIIVSRGR
jgi:drug/metabolite transporter (DMT)-like permease